MQRFLWVLGFAAFSGSVWADVTKDRYWSIDLAAGFGQDILGSEDTRRGGFYGVSLSYPEKRLTWRGNKAHIVWTGYYMFTKGMGFENIPVNHMHTYGVSATGRYWNHIIPGTTTFFDLGWGLVYNNITSRDLDTNINSTPFLGVGAAFEVGGTEVLTGVRWYHMSNAGTGGSNQGMNQYQVWVGVRF